MTHTIDQADTRPINTPSTKQSTASSTTEAPNQPISAHAVIARAAGLKLSSLTVNGFKSFADKTTFNFSDPITGIVGPNGCGKSNVVDAIKWVLGERSSKSLRGKEMIDVIFAGSAGRKPSGMASVTLTFENPKQTTPRGTGVPPVVLLDEINDEQDTGETPVLPACAHPEHDAHISDADADRAAEEGESEAAAIISQRSRIGRPLPIDADVVAVERRLYRDGKSKYIITLRSIGDAKSIRSTLPCSMIE